MDLLAAAYQLEADATNYGPEYYAADAGFVMNPMQCRGQVEGSLAQGIGWCLFERMTFNEKGELANTTFRNYQIPTFADIPARRFISPTPTTQSVNSAPRPESPINPVAPARANALKHATGIGCDTPPFTASRLFR